MAAPVTHARYKPVAGSQMSTPNVIPMADIMLVLLIIFMVITPMLQKDHPVNMAKAENPRDMADAEKEDAVVVAISRDGKLFIGNNPVNIDELTPKVEDMIADKVYKKVYL